MRGTTGGSKEGARAAGRWMTDARRRDRVERGRRRGGVGRGRVVSWAEADGEWAGEEKRGKSGPTGINSLFLFWVFEFN